MTYWLCRRAEEAYGSVVHAGDRIVYRSASRFSWIDAVFEIDPGTVCQVLSVEYDEAVGTPDYDEWDNHYYYRIRGLEGHRVLDTTEIISLFEVASRRDAFLPLCAQIKWLIADCQMWDREQAGPHCCRPRIGKRDEGETGCYGEA